MRNRWSNIRFLRNIPKTAKPLASECIVYPPTKYGLHPYKFRYVTRLSKIYRDFDGTPNGVKIIFSRPLRLCASVQ